jgi:hypothetical protein
MMNDVTVRAHSHRSGPMARCRSQHAVVGLLCGTQGRMFDALVPKGEQPTIEVWKRIGRLPPVQRRQARATVMSLLVEPRS